MELTEIQSQLEQVRAAMASENQRGAMAEQEKILNLQQQEQDLVRQLIEAQELAQQQEKEQRVQAQEEKVQSITFPYDFNAVFDDPRANEMIVELIQQFQRQAYTDHNAEVEQLSATYRDQLRAGEDREKQLQRQNAEIQKQLEDDSAKLADAVQSRDKAQDYAQQCTNEKYDLEQKLKNAAAQLEEAQQEIERLNSHIDDLRKEAAVGAQNSYKIQDISASDKLAQLVKESAAEKAARALERWNVTNPELAAPTLEVATAPATFPETQPEDDTVHNAPTETYYTGAQPPVIEVPTFQIPNSVPADIVANEQQGVQQEGATLEERVAALEAEVAALKAGQAA